jgi:18S rRNA (guanine1575-N7)-methyltransferase
MGQGVPLRPGAFDGAISISAVQWLCNADRSSHDPRRRLRRFFQTLYACLARGARAVLQVRLAGLPVSAPLVLAASERPMLPGRRPRLGGDSKAKPPGENNRRNRRQKDVNEPRATARCTPRTPPKPR